MTRNPYQVAGQKPTLRNSVFVFMDILGYKDLMRKSLRDGTQQQMLRRLHAALSKGRKGLEDKDISPDFSEYLDKDLFAIKAFTDNIVIGWPVQDDAESEFGNAFMHLVDFQLQMACKGFFVRGALAVAPAYVDDIAVFGQALAETYQGESELARDPRIILTKSAVRAAKQHLTYYPNPADAPHVREILRDSDGQWFLNYLESVLLDEDESGPLYDQFMLHKKAVEKKLSEHKSNPPIWSKYAWVASYHNHFCDLNAQHFDGKYRIDIDLFRASLSRIV